MIISNIIIDPNKKISKSKHIINKWIFKNTDPDFVIDLVTACYGDHCPLHLKTLNFKTAKIIPYFNWIENTFVLLPIKYNKNKFIKLATFSINHIEESCNLLKDSKIVSVSDIICNGSDLILLVEYKQFTTKISEKFRKINNNQHIKDLIIVQLSHLKERQENILSIPLSKSLKNTLKYIPDAL